MRQSEFNLIVTGMSCITILVLVLLVIQYL
jgi:hypothetical protein